MDDLSLTPAEYDMLLGDRPWIRSVDPYANLSMGWAETFAEMLDVLLREGARVADRRTARRPASVVKS